MNALILIIVSVSLFLSIQTKEKLENGLNTLTSQGGQISFILNQNSLYTKNNDILRDTACKSCHLEPNMLLPKSKLNYEQFRQYVRGEKRFTNNDIMPKYNTNEISDDKLMDIWKRIY